jgi:hypothetical protein
MHELSNGDLDQVAGGTSKPGKGDEATVMTDVLIKSF